VVFGLALTRREAEELIYTPSCRLALLSLPVAGGGRLSEFFMAATSTRSRPRRESGWYRESAASPPSIRAELTTAPCRRESSHRHCCAASSSARCRSTPRGFRLKSFRRRARPCIFRG